MPIPFSIPICLLLVSALINITINRAIVATTKRRQIGILKGIGIKRATILWSYVFQSIFYAAIGAGLGLMIVFFGLKPLFVKYPIDFPFSDGILVAEPFPTFVRVSIFMIAAVFAGLVPAWMVVRRNTLNAILGR